MDSDFQLSMWPKTKPLDSQLDVLLEFLREHRHLAKGDRIYDNKHLGNLWNACAERLNAIPEGVQKDGKAWAKFWRSWKYRVRLKEKELRDIKECNGELPSGLVMLSHREQSVLSLLKDKEQDATLNEDSFANEVALFEEDEEDEQMETATQEQTQIQMDSSVADHSVHNNEESLNQEPDDSQSDDTNLATLQNTESVETDPFSLEHYTKNKVSTQQVKALVAFLHKHPRLAEGLVRSDGQKHYPKQLWAKCASKLNALTGATKNPDGWSKVWRDLKYQVRQKALRCQAAREDSSLPRESFTNREKLILALIARVSKNGNGKTKRNKEVSSSRSSPDSEDLEYTIDNRRNVTGDQMSCLLKFIHEHPQLARRSRGSGQKYSPRKLWAKCAKRLNAIEDGAKKSSGRWAKVWRDLKYQARRKAMRYREAMDNGGFGAVPLTKREEFILYLIGENGEPDLGDARMDAVAQGNDGLQDDLHDNNFEDDFVPDHDDAQDNDTKQETQSLDLNEDIDDASKYLKMQKQSLENTKTISDKLQIIRANMARMTTALFDLSEYFSGNIR